MKFENQKLVRFVDEPIVNEQNERPFDLVINDKGIFLQVKCSSRKNRKKYVMICLVDLFRQLWVNLTPRERQQIREELDVAIAKQ